MGTLSSIGAEGKQSSLQPDCVKGYSPVQVEKSLSFIKLKYRFLLLNWHICHISKAKAP